MMDKSATLFEVKERDSQVYTQELREFLPEKIIDIHTHVWLDRFKAHDEGEFNRVVKWPHRVARDNSIEDLVETYRLMFPDKEVTPLCFSLAARKDDFDALNGYTARAAREHNFPALIFAPPWWSADELERRIDDGGFVGLKVYLNLAPEYIPEKEVRIFDFLPHHFLRVANRRGWIIMLHIPRDGRLGDPVNLAEMTLIEEQYPDVQIVIAHVGRAYCNESIGNAFEVLSSTRHMVFDFSANTNDYVFQRALETFGPKRLVFGSDLPILRMRTRRICEQGNYVNLVPKGMYGDVSGDRHMRELEGREADELTFFLYEEILAFKRAAERVGLSRDDVRGVFYENARRLLEPLSH